MPSTIFMFFKETFLFEVLVKHLSSPLGENEAEDEPIIKRIKQHLFENMSNSFIFQQILHRL